MANINKTLFPIPVTQNPSVNPLVPHVWPGITATSTELLRTMLSENHEKWHIYFNERRFHNHLAHTVLTVWALGGNEDALKDANARAAAIQRPAFASPQAITKDNWTEHLGDGNYYQAYLSFFKSQLEDKKFDYGAVIEEYVLAPEANYLPGGKTPLMLNRFISGVIHSFIHAGFGIEFNLPGLVAEGLALAAVEPHDAEQLFSPALFTGSEGAVTTDVHAFTILARILADPNASTTKPHDLFGFYNESLAKHGESIRLYVDQWIVEGSDIDKKVEELIWATTLIYGVGGSQKTEFNADFFYMHFVTSSLFISTIIKTLKNKSSQIRLLKGYFAAVLSWYVAQGRPPLDLRKFFANSQSLVASPPGPARTYHGVPIANPWHEIMQATLRHPDDHLCKLQRALASYATHFGNTAKRTFVNVPELDGVEEIDGTLFLRSAVLTMDRMGWVFDLEKTKNGFPVWDRRGFFDEA